jgi:PEP-CTERM motif
MIRRLLFTLILGFGISAGSASAGTVSYTVSVITPDFGAPGWIDFSFLQGNIDALSANASISGFVQSGYTFDGVTQTTPGVTGDLANPPLVIPNDQGAWNYYSQHVVNWGNFFSFTVIFSGPAVGTPATVGSAFRVTLYDENFIPLVSPLPDGEVANITINTDGTLSSAASTFDGGGASVAAVPEPGTVSAIFGLVGLAGFYWRRQRG